MLPKDSLDSGEQPVSLGRPSPLEATRAQVILVVLISIAAVSTLSSESQTALLVDAPAAVLQIDLNAATYEELNLLPGIGDKMAAKLIEQRQRYGGFVDWQAVESIPGMGPATVAGMKQWCQVAPPTSRENAIRLASRNH